jgi:hypothetical protein
MRPEKGLGALERFRGDGASVGVRCDPAMRLLGNAECSMTHNHKSPTSRSSENSRSDTTAKPPSHDREIGEFYLLFRTTELPARFRYTTQCHRCLSGLGGLG